MGIVDFILNLAGLLLWLNWRSIRFDPLTKRLPATLMGTLRPASPDKLRRWHLPLFIGGLLLLRAVIYRWVAPLWAFKLHFGFLALPFLSNNFAGMLLFSFLSFGVTLGVFYIGLLLLSLLKGSDPIHRFVKIPLGRVDHWSAAVKIILPFLGTVLAWFILGGLLDVLLMAQSVNLTHAANSMTLRIEQSIVMGLAAYLIWKFPVAVLLLLHLLNSYIYFGAHPIWNYINLVAQKLLQPLRKLPLQAGRVDFAPLLGLVLLFLTAMAVERGLMEMYRRLPL